MVNMIWTMKLDSQLRNLWEREGKSATEIGAVFGVTKNSVIGRAHRMGLSKRLRTTTPRKHGRPVTPWSRRVRLAAVPKTKVITTPRPVSVPGMVEPQSLNISTIELTEHTCKWPHGTPGEGGFGFCGHNSQSGLPYCEYHSILAYRQPDPKRDLRTAKMVVRMA